MTTIIDTNVLLRVTVEDEPGSADVAKAFLSQCSEIIVPTVAFCEFVWVSMRSYRSPRLAVAATIRSILADPRVVCDRQAVEAGLAMLEAGGDFADGVIAFEGRRLGGKIFASFDRKATQLLRDSGLETRLLAG